MNSTSQPTSPAVRRLVLFVDRLVFFIARTWLWLATGILFLYIAIPLLAPVLMHYGFQTQAEWIYNLFSLERIPFCIVVKLRYIPGMRPYSNDLRQRVLAAVKAGKQTQADIATTFGISQSTLENWWHAWRTKRQATALPHRSGPSRTLQVCDAFLRAEVKREPDVTLAELCTRVAQTYGVSASPSMMCRELAQLNLPRKKSRSTTANGKLRG